MANASIPTSSKKGAIEPLYTAPPATSVVICLDEMGPQASKSSPGQRLLKPAGPKAERATQEIDYDRRDVAGYVFQPKHAAYLNLIEPWWKVLRSLALKGRRFDAWAEIEDAVKRATAYWNAYKHTFVWGRRRRHRTPRRPGIAAVPNVALI